MNKSASSPAPAPPRRAAKRAAISATIRREITRGRYRPGARLPNQLAFARRFRVSVLTVQRAMNELAREGFIETRHAQGTFVVAQPPHLNRYALIFHADPTELELGGWSRLYATLHNAAMKLQQREGRQFECFYGINGPDTASYQRLLARAQAHQFAGLIFTTHPGRLVGSPLLAPAGLPRVGLMSDASFAKVLPQVAFDGRGWFEKAFDHLAARGCRRVAFVSQAGRRLPFGFDGTPAALARHKLTTRPEWNLPLPLWTDGAQHSVQLLMQSAGERPDALVITDDNVVKPALAGLLAAGVSVPEDVAVVAHANFPRSGPRGLPLTWLGYDNYAALAACVAVIDCQCRGDKPPGGRLLPARFEQELTTRTKVTELAPARPN